MENKTDFDRIGVNTITCLFHQGRWKFRREGALFDMAPAELTDYVLSPCIIGADRLIQIGCKLKNIQNYEQGFLLLFSENYFPNADVKFTYSQPKYDGWIYKVEELNLKGLMPGQEAWICPYMIFYYDKPPESIFIKIEELQS